MKKRRRYGEIKKIAEMVGKDRTYISAVLRNKQRGSIKLCKQLSKITGISFFDLRPDLKRIMKDFNKA